MRTHALIFGSTGSGKTEALISIAYNALLQASGFIYIDGKGDNSLFAKIFSMCRMMIIRLGLECVTLSGSMECFSDHFG